MVSMGLPVATLAFLLGMRLARGRYLAPRKDWGREALVLASAKETRWALVGNTVMSVPISAMMSWALTCPMPGIASSWVTWCSQGSARASIFVVSSWICAV